MDLERADDYTGFWQGPDGKGIVAALQAGTYGASNEPGLEADGEWIKKIENNKASSGMAIAYRYFGTGDRGGAPSEESCLNLETAIAAGVQIRVGSPRHAHDATDAPAHAEQE